MWYSVRSSLVHFSKPLVDCFQSFVIHARLQGISSQQRAQEEVPSDSEVGEEEEESEESEKDENYYSPEQIRKIFCAEDVSVSCFFRY